MKKKFQGYMAVALGDSVTFGTTWEWGGQFLKS